MSLEVDIHKKLASFDLEVAFKAEDETVGFLGASGCGKSMTLRCIAGIETPDEGRIVVNGETYFDSSKKINLTAQQRKTALLFQNFQLFPNLTVAQNIGAGIGSDVSSADRKKMVNDELERFDLEVFAKRYPMQLSGGQQQRVALARMLAAKPGILMLDEPFSALDAHLKGVLEQNLVSLFDLYKGTVLYVSHDIDEAIRFCDRIAVVEDGHIMEIDTGRELVKHPHSLAGIKLSGCKNAMTAQRVADHRIYCPEWGIELETEEQVPDDIKAFGVRAFFIKRADAPSPNVYRTRVDNVSDSRFERTVLLSFLDRDRAAERRVAKGESEMTYLHQHMFWRVDMLKDPEDSWPVKGEELLINIPKEALYLVTR